MKIIQRIFNSFLTAEHVTGNIDLSGKVAIVTGADSGIGEEVARVLALRGAHVILACRNEEKMKKSIQRIKENTKNDQVEGLLLDLASFDSIKNFVEEFKELQLPLHILVHNAGVFGIPYTITEDDVEMSMSVHLFGPFLLTILLLDILEASGPSRIVFVTSEVSRYLQNINLDDINWRNGGYNWIYGYAHSKLANLMLALELNEKLKERGSKIICNAAHPGVVRKTSATRHFSRLYQFFYNYILFPFTKSPAQGAATVCFCAASPFVEDGGHYYANCLRTRPPHYARNKEAREELWGLCESFTGVKF